MSLRHKFNTVATAPFKIAYSVAQVAVGMTEVALGATIVPVGALASVLGVMFCPPLLPVAAATFAGSLFVGAILEKNGKKRVANHAYHGGSSSKPRRHKNEGIEGIKGPGVTNGAAGSAWVNTAQTWVKPPRGPAGP